MMDQVQLQMVLLLWLIVVVRMLAVVEQQFVPKFDEIDLLKKMDQ